MSKSTVVQQGETEARQLESLKARRLGPYLSHNPVSATQIWQWCSVMGDNNPDYLPGDNQLAPPAMMQMWTMRDVNDRYAPGSTEDPPYKVFDDMKAMGYPANVAVSYDIRFHRYLCIGERPMHYTSVVNISAKKTTALGIGYFVTERVEYSTHENGLFAEAFITYFQYQPATATAPVEGATAGVPGEPEIPLRSCADARDTWQPDFTTIDAQTIHSGMKLPTVTIPITHRLIVAGAIATQDFIPVHHNLPAAKAAGMPDIFMNILTTSGLVARYLTDWTGAGSRLLQLKFSLMKPNLPGDVMALTGEVTAVECEDNTSAVEVSFTGTNRLGLHTSGTAKLALPNIQK
ncbi:MAG: MaoC/PaaZ C-terminal domain-containing protein [Halioglobus sp.]